MVVRTAVVGGGTISRVHLRGARKNPQTELVGVCDLDGSIARERAREFGTMAFTDFSELLAAGIDCLHICTPVQSHFEIASQAIEAGVGVIIEKPATVTVEEIEKLEELSEEHDVPATVIHNHLFYPVVRQAREMIESGELGQLQSVDVIYTGLTPPDQVNRGSWVFDLPGGEFEEGIPHPIYTVLGVGGFPKRVDGISAQTALLEEYEDGFSYDQAQVNYVSESDVLCSVKMLSGGQPQRLHVINGSEKSLLLDEINQSLYTVDEDYTSSPVSRTKKAVDVSMAQFSSTAQNVKLVASNRLDDSWENEIQSNSHFAIFDAFVECLEGEEDVPASLEQSKWTIRVMEAIRTAAQSSTGETEPVEEPVSITQ